MHRYIFTAFAVLFCALSGIAQAVPSLDNFANRLEVEYVSLSPSGDKIAYLRNDKDDQFVVIQNLTTGEIVRATQLDDIKPFRIEFVSDDYVLLYASVFKARDALVGKGEFRRVLSYSVASGRTVQLLERALEIQFQDKLFNLTNVVGVDDDGLHVYMAAFASGGSRNTDVFKVNLSTGDGDVVSFGADRTRDYAVRSDGQPVLRWQYSNVQNTYSLDRWTGQAWEMVLARENVEIPLNARGISADGASAFFSFDDDDWGSLRRLDLNGQRPSFVPVLDKPGTETITSLNKLDGEIIGVAYGGLLPTYRFFDAALTRDVAQLQARFRDTHVRLVDWTSDRNVLLFRIDIAAGAQAYILFNRSNGQLTRVADGHSALTADAVSKPVAFPYKARDGQQVPAILTMPLGATGAGPSPLIVMPHGGPESFDQIGYDWMAQAFASRGYMVLQPNFRGSTGFGRDWRDAGRGDWRGIMQTDIVDGIEALAGMQMIDPDRVCAVGASYGGYSALALATFYPDSVSCAVAIAPVTDLPKMLQREQAVRGRASWVVEYWRRVMGDWRSQEERLAQASPARFAGQIKAPILLIHGREDLVVPLSQTNLMADALKRAKVEHEVVRISDGDHWLSTSRERRKTLSAAMAFVQKHTRSDAVR